MFSESDKTIINRCLLFATDASGVYCLYPDIMNIRIRGECADMGASISDRWIHQAAILLMVETGIAGTAVLTWHFVFKTLFFSADGAIKNRPGENAGRQQDPFLLFGI